MHTRHACWAQTTAGVCATIPTNWALLKTRNAPLKTCRIFFVMSWNPFGTRCTALQALGTVHPQMHRLSQQAATCFPAIHQWHAAKCKQRVLVEPLLSPWHWASSTLLFFFPYPHLSCLLKHTLDKKGQLCADAIPVLWPNHGQSASFLNSNIPLYLWQQKRTHLIVLSWTPKSSFLDKKASKPWHWHVNSYIPVPMLVSPYLPFFISLY